jgi:hypothetical protein
VRRSIEDGAQSRARRARAAACALLLLVGLAHADDELQRLVFGSFEDQANAQRWAERVARELNVATEILRFEDSGRVGYRVTTRPHPPDALAAIGERAQARGMAVWRLTEVRATGTQRSDEPGRAAASAALPPFMDARVHDTGPSSTPSHPVDASADSARDATRRELDVDLGAQTRLFAHEGFAGQDRVQPSLSARLQYYHGWDDDRTSVRAIPFVRYDAMDDERSHGDLRELQITHVGDDWEVHAGVRQVFWGVTEFVHLVDIVNQVDLVESIDGEDRLGQPMVDVSFVRDWGVLDLMVLPGFRERTFPGEDGRLRYALPVDGDARYQSDDEEWHVDVAARVRGHIGPVEFGLYQFRGTGRDPDLLPTLEAGGRLVLTPYYPQIDQTGLDAQAILGDWLWKLEALRRSGQGGHYTAATGGFEWTWVGAAATRMDVGFVLEYLYDGRDDAEASIFEHDVGLATRWRVNDVADSQALLGVVWDHETDEYVVKLEGSRRLGDAWSLNVEGRVFGGAESLPGGPAGAWLDALADPDAKTSAVQRDDYLQLELIRYF